MIGFSNRYLIIDSTIIEKRTGKKYILPDSLKKYLSEKNSIFDYPAEFITYLLKEGILVENSVPYNPFVKSSFMNNQRLLIQITEKCNLFCAHCFQEASIHKKIFYSFDDITNILEEAVSYGIMRIDFTGGEITTIDWFTKLIDYLDNLPIAYSLFTNLVIEKFSIREKMLQSKGLYEIITSLDYWRSEKQDSFRGKKGAFETTLKNILEFQKNGYNICVNSMILEDNINDVLNMFDFFIPKGIGTCIDTVVPKGRAKKSASMSSVMEKNVDSIFKIKEYLYKKYNIELQFKGARYCGVGNTLLYLSAKNKYYLCPGLTDTEDENFFLGTNIKEAIINRSKINIECSKKHCQFYLKCGQGCREKAFLFNNSCNECDEYVYKILKRELRDKN